MHLDRIFLILEKQHVTIEQLYNGNPRYFLFAAL